VRRLRWAAALAISSQESAWLIELNGGPTRYWFPGGWTEDVNEALRFVRKQDAEAVVRWAGFRLASVREHVWVKA